MKILQLCAIDRTLNSILLPLVDRMQEEGWDVTACCTKGDMTESLRERGYKIKSITIPRSLNPFLLASAVLKLTRFIKSKKFDVVQVHTPVAAMVGRLAARLAGVPLVIYTSHGFYFNEDMGSAKYRFYLWLEKLGGRFLTDYMFTVSSEDRETAVKEKIIKPEKIETAGSGVDTDNLFNPLNIDKNQIEIKRKKLNIGLGDRVIIYVGRIVKEKGLLDLLEAFKGINDGSVKLLLVGDCHSSERDRTTIETIKKAAEENPGIIMAGRRKDIRDLLYMSRVFVLPSYREGLPRSIMEAMAMGLPVVASDIRGCREEVADGETGFLVAPGDAEDLKNKLIKLINNSSLAQSMGNNSRKRAEMLYNERKALDKVIHRVRKLTENQR